MSTIPLKPHFRIPPYRGIRIISSCVFFILVVSIFRGSFRLDSYLPGIAEAAAANPDHNLLDDIFNATLGFEKIFAINMPERIDHRDALILASSLSDIHVEFIDGVHGDTITEKALPPGDHGGLGPSNIGAWRAHMNAISAVVQQNLSSVLILEDDVDWDIRLRPLLQDFARAAVVLQQEPVEGRNVVQGHYEFDSLPHITHRVSPYGDQWDVLWLGHCGMELAASNEAKVVHKNDETVPKKEYLKSFDFTKNTPLIKYPHHTQVTTHAHEGTCSLAYAVSQQGARRVLYNIGLQKLDGTFDNMLSGWCDGTNFPTAGRCFGVIPQLFDHHRSAGPLSKDSDISKPKDGDREESYTLNIRWSVRKNIEKLLSGQTDYYDQYPDNLKNGNHVLWQ